MVRKRLDERIRGLLERSVATGQRSLLVLVGDRGRDQIPVLHQILSRLQWLPGRSGSSSASNNNNSSNSSSSRAVTWCYKRELGFSTHRTKRLKKLKRDKARGLLNGADEATGADAFELFVGQNEIHWCYYRDSHRVLGTTCQLLVLQDFEALTPNLMARTMETVAGGGLIVVLLRTVRSLKQLYAMSMDVHSRYRTESAGDVVPRFNERFLLSLCRSNRNCLVCDDELNVLPVSRRALKGLSSNNNNNNTNVTIQKGDAGEVVVPETPDTIELKQLQESLADTPHVGVLVDLCKTLDQARAVLTFLEACAEKGGDAGTTAATTVNRTVALTAARGRGKSAALGLCLAGAVSLGYSTVAVTAPEPENLVAVFDFVLRGLRALKYQEHADYTVQRNSASGREATRCVVAVRLHRSHRQVIQYVPPTAATVNQFATAEIVAIDEAAAIPLPTVRAILQQQQRQQQSDRLAFLSSTVNGYEGTGRALSLKLLQELRSEGGRQSTETATATTTTESPAKPPRGGRPNSKRDAQVHEHRYAAAAAAASNAGSSPRLRELELTTPIRYAAGDAVEKWLNQLLCLDSGGSARSPLKLAGGAPAPGDCELYSVDRDALFSYHTLSEAFLQKLMGLYTAAHYKNTPNDLQMLSDAPAHSIFCLLSPAAEQDSNRLPDVLAVVQVALEGRVSRRTVQAQLARGHRAAGDLIPWTVSQQFGDSRFAQLSGARIVRVAVHPAVQGMGYGTRAVELLYRFYNGEMVSLDAAAVTDSNVEDNDNDNEEGEKEGGNQSDSDDDEEDEEVSVPGDGIRAETLKPRKELPPLLLPLTEVDAPRLDWIGTSFGLTLQLHKFWTRCGMKLLYLRQTQNDLTGEHSCIMVRALPKRTGVDDAWLPAFMSDARRRLITLLGGSFRDLEIRLALSILENVTPPPEAEQAVAKAERSGSYVGNITADELDHFFTPHDLKRLELYGRNLCDHHLVTDLLPVIARLYFLGRLGPDAKLSSVQAALLCGIGLQHKTVNGLTDELGLPSNQVLAMFNKAVRKISMALNGIVEEREKEAMMGDGEKRRNAEASVVKMRDVTRVTLEDDINDMAKDAMVSFNSSQGASLPQEIAEDRELMQYVVKGSNKQWEKALDGKTLETDGPGTVSIQSVREKRKNVDEEDIEREAATNNTRNSSGKKKKAKSSKQKKKR